MQGFLDGLRSLFTLAPLFGHKRRGRAEPGDITARQRAHSDPHVPACLRNMKQRRLRDADLFVDIVSWPVASFRLRLQEAKSPFLLKKGGTGHIRLSRQCRRRTRGPQHGPGLNAPSLRLRSPRKRDHAPELSELAPGPPPPMR